MSMIKKFLLNMYVSPLYKVFISKNLRIEGRAIDDLIVKMIKEWGF